MIIAVDTEAGGRDFYHGTVPFFVTVCRDDKEQICWEWDVDPMDRQPLIPDRDIEEIKGELDRADEIVFQNAPFDAAALKTLGIELEWRKVHDTLVAGHLLASNQPHNLTEMAFQYLAKDIRPYEDRLEEAVKLARRTVRTDAFMDKYGEWRIAKEGLPEMPSCKTKKGWEGQVEGPWRYDYWLPRAVSRILSECGDWESVLRDYSNMDSAVTLGIWKRMEKMIRAKGLWNIYLHQAKLPAISHQMMDRGVTYSLNRMDRLITEFGKESGKAGEVCTNIALDRGYALDLPKSGMNNSIRRFLFGTAENGGNDALLDIPILKQTGTGEPSLDKSVLMQLELILGGDALSFIRSLGVKRKRDKAIGDMVSYKKFGVQDGDGWRVLHPSLNQTGTDTLRWSCSNPNEQNIAKEEIGGASIRYCLGPRPGREWWGSDAKNLELRIPAYESEEKLMMDLFDRVDDPPYFGSYHLLIFDILHPKEFAKHGVECKEIYASTLYQWVKNGNFATAYGAVEESGTADRAYHVPGAQRMVKDRLRNISALNEKYIGIANRLGYVETIPDKSVDPHRGYPLICSRSQHGRVIPTIPFNYHVQGTAMWWMDSSMVRVNDFFIGLNQGKRFLNRTWPGGYFLCLQVHDELVFDCPKGKTMNYNLPVMRHVKRLMEQSGENIGVPTPVSLKYHPETWSKGVSV